MKKLLTSESVTQGHPDKVCDQISDAVLDAYLSQDKHARVACECLASANAVFITGEITSTAQVDIEVLARQVIKEIGYEDDSLGFTGDSVKIIVDMNKQSPDIALGVDHAKEYKENSEDPYDLIGAGDQGIVFGYACNETEEFMPLPIVLAHKLAKRLAKVREDGVISYLRPDGKTQVTVEYEDDKPNRIDTILISTQHNDGVDLEDIRKDLIKEVIELIVPKEYIDEDTKILVNPTGRFVIGGPQSDVGLTGRKIIVDTYGGFSKHGGGAYSGKDPSKVDRSASYMARYIAKNIVAAGLADKVEIGVAYAIGVARPVSIYVDTFASGKVSDDELTKIVNDYFDLRPKAIIDKLELDRPIYRLTAAYGHYGRDDIRLPWEGIDKVFTKKYKK